MLLLHTNQNLHHFINNFQGSFGEFLLGSFMPLNALKLNIRAKEKPRRDILTLLLTAILQTLTIFCRVSNMSKKIRHSDGVSASDISAIKEDIHVIRQDMQCLYQIDRSMKIPAALYRKLSETFKCNICHHAPITPPVIFARCCKAIVGCQKRVDTWFMGDDGITKKCPLCGTDRALPDTMRLHGLDDFLLAIQPLLSDPHDIEGDSTSA